jgi:hypothetical protein
MKSLSNELFSWKITLSFVSVVTLIILLIGWLITHDALPLSQVIHYSEPEANFIRLWVKIALAIGVLLPVIGFMIWIRDRDSRKVLGFYLLVLIIQIVTEQILSSVWFPSIVVIVGTLYTIFRLWQLWQGQQLIASTPQLGTDSSTILKGLLWFMLLFWFSNILMLLIVAWPSILQHL